MLLDSGTSEGEWFIIHRLLVVEITSNKRYTSPSLALLPASLVHAIYQDLPGAVFDVDNQVWTVPCDTGKVNVSLVIGNQTYPVHPLDVVVPPYPDDFYPGQAQVTNPTVTQCSVAPPKRQAGSNTTGTNSGTPICLAAFNCAGADLVAFAGVGECLINRVYICWSHPDDPVRSMCTRVDGILGDTFLRNVYMQFNYGNWSRNGTGTPFVRLLNVRPSFHTHRNWISNLQLTSLYMPHRRRTRVMRGPSMTT